MTLQKMAVSLGYAALFAGVVLARAQTPSSTGPVAVLDEPVFRIPRTDSPPVIDGVIEEGEWEDASALSGFWYDYSRGGHARFYFLAPIETQLQLYAMYDDDHLYLAYTSPVYPVGSWLRSRGRFPNVQNHPRYGVLRDDHIEFELRPYHDVVHGFQLGLLKLLINPIDTVADFYWSPTHGSKYGWDSGVKARSEVTDTNWTIEMAIPFESLAFGLYDGVDEDGREIVTMPPPDGTVYRCWFARGISGTGPFFNAFDMHIWNTTKTMMIFDSNAVAFQINELGPILDDVVDVHITVKNHSDRSELLRLGFFAENAYGLIYSSYEDDVLTDGVLELIPGEMRELRLRQPFPGITERGNTLWFDVRTAGSPAKAVFLTRLMDFHAHDKQNWSGTGMSFREAEVDVIETLRPPRMDFDARFDLCPYNNRFAAVIDRGIHGAGEAAQTAVEARVSIVHADSGDEIARHAGPFYGDFSIVKFDLPQLCKDSTYEMSVLLFDEDRRIAGAYISEQFNKWGFPFWMVEPERGGPDYVLTPVNEWLNNRVGLADTVWEPYTPLEVTEDGFRSLKHEFELDGSGLPAQVFIKPSDRALPLELRGSAEDADEDLLVSVGRGPLLRAPVRLEAVVDGRRYAAEAVGAARLVRHWESELEYHSRLRAGPVDIDLKVQYDCDGSWHVTMDYGTEGSQEVELLEMVTDVRGPVDKVTGGRSGGHMAGAPVWECSLPDYEGVVWDITTQDRGALSPHYFAPWFHFGSGDRGLSWMADSDRGWGLDRDGTSMTLERDPQGEVTWRVKFVNHPFDVQGMRSVDFSVLMHPARPKPEGYRKVAWHYRSDTWASGFASERVDLSEEYLRRRWRRAAKAPDHIPWEEAAGWRNERPPWNRYGRPRNLRIAPDLDFVFEQRASYLLERQIRVGRRHGWWWDEYWPAGYGTTDNLASGCAAYVRDPGTVKEGELPWRDGWTSGNMRMLHKRLARVFEEENVPQRQFHWANAQANMLESVGWDAQLVEGCGGEHRSLDLDIITQYPMSLYRFMAHPFTGLPVRLVADRPTITGYKPGDDPRLDRQVLGLSILHDMGYIPHGPHGVTQNVNYGLRLLDILDEFGYFDDAGTELVPYWRGQDIVRWGEGRRRYAPRPELNVREPHEQLYVSVYRRGFRDESGRQGYKALFVLLNGFREDVTADLTVLRPERLFGGPNTLTRDDVLSRYGEEFGEERALLEEWNGGGGEAPVLVDLEDGSMVELISAGGGETYGSVRVPRHNFRLLYGHFLE